MGRSISGGPMKIQLETIPVWDAMKTGSECYLCDLKLQSEKDGVAFFLGPSVMNPETRVNVNEHGFCRHHFEKLIEAGKPQGLGLMAETYLETDRKAWGKAMESLLQAKAGRKMDKAVAAFSDAVASRSPHCLICSRVEDREVRYLYTTVRLFITDLDFKVALKHSKGFCIPHFQRLLDISQKALSSEERRDFVQTLTEVELSNLERLQHEVVWMTEKYKTENFDKPWNGCEDAQKRVVRKLTGM
jgi:hypothetical protein